MFYIRKIDSLGSVISETKETDYESFIIKCYNFREDEGLDSLEIFYVGNNNERRILSAKIVEEMIDTWLDPDFMFALGYPLTH